MDYREDYKATDFLHFFRFPGQKQDVEFIDMYFAGMPINKTQNKETSTISCVCTYEALMHSALDPADYMQRVVHLCQHTNASLAGDRFVKVEHYTEVVFSVTEDR